MRRVTTLFLALLMTVISGCGRIDSTLLDLHSIKSYKDIPGITEEETSAIEALKQEKGSFSYGLLFETEAFKQADGTYAGFSIRLGEFLSELFGIEFKPTFYDADWESLKADIDNQTLDFSGSYAAAAGYYMTTPISGRLLRIYTLKGSQELLSEYDVNGLRIGFLEDTADVEFIMTHYPELSFKTVSLSNYNNAVEMLKLGSIDAFVMSGEIDSNYESYDFIRFKDFFSLAYTPVSIATANPSLEPIISVINKYLASGGSDKLFELSLEGRRDYSRYKLHNSFTAEEKAYLNDLAARGAKIDIGIQHDVYPVSFYNETEGKFGGIAIDILSEISKLTDIEFEPITTSTDTPLSEILAKLKAGEISMMTQLLYSDSRKNDYLWNSSPYHTTNYALLSGADFPNLETYQVYYAKVGTINKSAHEEMFNKWFPNHINRITYSTTSEGFDALENGEIDLLMLCENMLLTLSNYREKPGFKVNVNFNKKLDSFFGYSKNEEILRSIVDKALVYVDTDKISDDWLTRSFDYSHKMARMQTMYLSIFSFAALIMLVFMFFLFYKNKRLDKKLIERTTTLATIYSSIPDLVYSKGMDSSYASCNPSFAKYAGVSEAELVGKKDEEVFKAYGLEAAGLNAEADERVMINCKPERAEETIIYPDGTRSILEIVRTPLIESGKTVGVLGVARDITERKEMETQLHRALTSAQATYVMFESIINTAQIAFVMATDNIITQVNEYSKYFMGMNVGDNIQSFYTDSMQHDNIMKRLEQYQMIPNIIVGFNMPDSGSHRFLSTFSEFQYGQDKAFIVWAIDIEEAELKNDRLRITQESLQTVLDNLPVPVRIFDMETTEIVYANNSLLELLEYDSPDELCGLKMQETLPDIQSDETTASELVYKIRDAVAANPVSIEVEYRTKTGKILEALVVCRLIDYKGKLSAIGIIKDLTEERERARILLNAVEREKEANQSKSRFLANMSHEIRTPMNAIIGMSELLMNEQLTSRQQGYVNDINISSHALLSIINDILDLSKIEAGKLELSPVDYDFHIFIDNICSMFQFIVQKKDIEFRFEINGILPKCLFGDDVRLRQVLTNICGNAVKFTSKGSIGLKITVEDKVLTFEISDTGIGISKEDLPKLFQAFVQADTQKNRNIKGTGLGLSISKAFVEMMGGTISADSVYGHGTVFTVTIPKVIGDESSIMCQEQGEETQPFFAPSAKVLVVDDNELNLKVASGLLNMYKINAETVLSGREAIDLIKETDYDIVFMDHMMPGMDGIETTSEIRKLGGKYKRMTIIALTANAVRGAKEMFIANEFDGFISKPINLHELVGILREWIPRKKIEIQCETTPQEKANENNTSFWDSIKKINGINADIGLSRVSGMEAMYFETLKLFVKTLLTECSKMEGFLNNKDLRNLAISVHGMKSSLSTIGAMELSETAFILETASKNEELDYCEDYLPSFMKNLRSLHDQLLAIMPEEEVEAARPVGDTVYLQDCVQEAINALNDFEGDLAMEEVRKLIKYDFGVHINQLLKGSINAINEFEFQSAISLLSEINATYS